jgi:negative regulator of sigma E activity
MGTDFTYEDITDPKLEQYEYTTLRRERVDGVACTVIQAVPTDPKLKAQSAYSRTVYWVEPVDAVTLKIEYHDRAGRLLKVLRNEDLSQYGQYRRWRITRVRDVARNHQTVVTVTDRTLDRGLRDAYFGVSYLERGR